MYTIPKEEQAPLARLETLLSFIRLSVGTHMFRRLFVVRHNGLEDVIGDGDLACALYASSMLHMFNLIKGGVHTTVDVTTQDMLDSGWVKSDVPSPGAVVVWGKKLSNTDRLMHRHIGICVDLVNAVSTDSKTKAPVIHPIHGLKNHEGKQRLVEAYFTHPNLVPAEDIAYI